MAHLRVPRIIDSEPTPIAFSSADWSCFETSYGRPVPGNVRDDLSAATNKYLCFAPFDAFQPGPWRRHAQERIKSICAHARSLRESLVRRSDKQDAASAQHGEQLIAKHFDNLIARKKRGDSFAFLVMLAGCLVAASERAKAELLNSGDAPTLAWDQWSNAISLILAKNGLPYGARKSGSAPLVALMREIQKRLPQQYRRHVHPASDDEVLAQAINRARSPKVKQELKRLGDIKRR